MRGYGKSDKPSGIDKYDIVKVLAEDVRAVLNYFKKDLASDATLKPLLVSHYWGSIVCWNYACQEQTIAVGDIAGLVSLAIPPPRMFEDNMDMKQLWSSLYIIFFNVPWLPEKICLAGNACLIGVLIKDTKRTKIPDWLINIFRGNVLQEGSMEAQFNYYRTLVQQPASPVKEDYGTKENPLPLPTLVIRGLDDVAIRDSVFKTMQMYLKNNKLVNLENCSHWIQLDCPNGVNSENGGFLSNLS